MTDIFGADLEMDLGDAALINPDRAVQYVPQTLTDVQKAQARQNVDAYAKPSGGIPETDLAPDVQTILDEVGTTVRFSTQTLTNEQKAQARANINALTDSDLPYVTPEMYGAKGDGVTDDTAAIQDAFDSGSYVFFPKGIYKTTEPIIIANKDGLVINSENAQLLYTGNDSAFIMRHVQNSTFYLGEVRAPSGKGIRFDATQSGYWSQYINIFFRLMVCNSDCIYASIENDSWVNQVNLMNGRFSSNANGVHIYHNTTAPCDNWNFINVGFEGVVNGAFFENTMLQTYGYIHGMSFIGCRYQESFTKLIKSVGYVQDVSFLGADTFSADMLDVDLHANNWIINAPITNNNFNKAYIRNGTFVNELEIVTKTITAASAFTTVGSNLLKKCGKTVTIKLDGKYAAGSGYISIGALPAGFIPSENIVCARTINANGAAAYIRINSNSRVEIYCPSITSGNPDFYIYETFLVNS